MKKSNLLFVAAMSAAVSLLMAPIATADELPSTAASGGGTTLVSPDEIPEGTYVAPGVDLDKPIVSSENYSPEQVLSQAQVAPQSDNSLFACGPYAGWGPPGGWLEYQWTDCSFMGWDANTQKVYVWNVAAGTSGNACTQGMGYTSSGPVWRNTGCGSGGSGSAPWGNSVGTPRYKVTSTMIPLGVMTRWS